MIRGASKTTTNDCIKATKFHFYQNPDALAADVYNHLFESCAITVLLEDLDAFLERHFSQLLKRTDMGNVVYSLIYGESLIAYVPRKQLYDRSSQPEHSSIKMDLVEQKPTDFVCRVVGY